MRSTFRALAGLIAFGVVVQAASIAYAAFALAHVGRLWSRIFSERVGGTRGRPISRREQSQVFELCPPVS
ncbi:MAG: hypothetical protein QOH56_206 [Pseudonocardiales bacterium]|nr:hypothetical protein [Pseudonocardiales bacterium]